MSNHNHKGGNLDPWTGLVWQRCYRRDHPFFADQYERARSGYLHCLQSIDIWKVKFVVKFYILWKNHKADRELMFQFFFRILRKLLIKFIYLYINFNKEALKNFTVSLSFSSSGKPFHFFGSLVKQIFFLLHILSNHFLKLQLRQ